MNRDRARREELGRLLAERERRRAYHRGKRDAVWFVENFCRIEDRDTPGVLVPFVLWKEQKRVLRELERHRMTVVLKARQLGLTWLALCYAVRRMVYDEGYTVLALSRTENEAKELVRRVGVILGGMKDLLRQAGSLSFRSTALSVHLCRSRGVESVFRAMPSAPGAGRSFTASLVLLDEWAFQQFAREIWTAAFPCVNRPTGGQVIGLSTMARGTLFEEIYCNDNGFHKVFLPWTADPRRDEAWYTATAAVMGPLMRQEYPASVEEALSCAGGAFFPELRADVHLVDMPDITGCRKYVSIDYGLDALAALWVAVDSRGKAMVYRELYRSGLIVSEAAEALRTANGADEIVAWLAPPDLWNRNRDTGRSTAEIFASRGILLLKTANARVSGWLDVKEWLRPVQERDEQTGALHTTAALRFVRGKTPELWRTMTAIQCDGDNPNDAALHPHELTHLPDSLRVFCAGRPTGQTEGDNGRAEQYDNQIGSFLEYGGS